MFDGAPGVPSRRLLWFRRDGSRRLKSFLVLDVDEQMVGTRRDETLEDDGGVSLPSGET